MLTLERGHLPRLDRRHGTPPRRPERKDAPWGAASLAVAAEVVLGDRRRLAWFATSTRFPTSTAVPGRRPRHRWRSARRPLHPRDDCSMQARSAAPSCRMSLLEREAGMFIALAARRRTLAGEGRSCSVALRRLLTSTATWPPPSSSFIESSPLRQVLPRAPVVIVAAAVKEAQVSSRSGRLRPPAMESGIGMSAAISRRSKEPGHDRPADRGTDAATPGQMHLSVRGRPPATFGSGRMSPAAWACFSGSSSLQGAGISGQASEERILFQPNRLATHLSAASAGRSG